MDLTPSRQDIAVLLIVIVVDGRSFDYTRETGFSVRRLSMPKALCLVGMVVAVLLLLVFGLDLAVGFPFKRASIPMDVGTLVCSALLGYASWTTLKEQK
jgi:hypothetical protein